MPRIPLSAIFSFAILGFGGALLLAYGSFERNDFIQVARQNGDALMHFAQAVPASPNAGLAGPRSGQFGPLATSEEVLRLSLIGLALVALAGAQCARARCQRLVGQGEAGGHFPAPS
jgi:hypothetical protein